MGSWMARREMILSSIEATKSRIASKIHARTFAIESKRFDTADRLDDEIEEDNRVMAILKRSLDQVNQRGS